LAWGRGVKNGLNYVLNFWQFFKKVLFFKLKFFLNRYKSLKNEKVKILSEENT
jgi:hypothetical protein